MAKISELADGGNLLNDDELIVLRAGGNVRATVANLPEVDASGNQSFADGEKAIFGTGSDLQIYHSGATSFITENGTGDLRLSANNLLLRSDDAFVQSEDGTVNSARFNSTTGVTLYRAGSAKLATTSTGIDVTGTVTADGLTVNSGATNTAATFESTDQYAFLNFQDNTSTDGTFIGAEGNNFIVQSDSTKRLFQAEKGGDISFYDTAGTGAKFFWDASAESLGIGTSAPSTKLHVDTGSAGYGLTLGAVSQTSLTYQMGIDSSSNFAIYDSFAASQRMVIDTSGNVGIGTDSPASLVTGGSSPVLSIGGTDSGLVTGEKAGSLSFITSDPSYTATYADGITGEVVSVAESAVGGAYGLAFYAGTTGAAGRAERLRITNAGNVGIGTDSPSAALTIGSPDSSAIGFVSNGVASLGGGIAFDAGAGNDVQLFNYRTSNMQFGNGGTADVTIDSSGNVGIGTSSPNYNLTSYKVGANANYLQVANGSTGVSSANGTLFGVDASGNGVVNVQGSFDYITSVAGVERMRIDSSGNVGIGTSSPNQELHVQAGTGLEADIRISGNNGASSYLDLFHNAGGSGMWNASNTPLQFATNGTERMRIDSIGNVKIGTATDRFSFLTASTANLQIDGGVVFDPGSGNNVEIFNYRATDMLFGNSGSEAMRIDSSGNLLVGKQVSSLGTEGVTLGPNGQHYFTSEDETALKLNRLTTEGEIIQFRKDGTTVGSIGTDTNGQLFIGEGDTGLGFQSNNDALIPRNTSGAARDGAINLGTSSARFKDLYLSGGAYLGGTAAANKLDDYEEGTIASGINSGITLGNGTLAASYTKAGNIVVATYELFFGSTTTVTGDVSFNLPFTLSQQATSASAYLVEAGVQFWGAAARAGVSTVSVSALNSSGTYAGHSTLSSTVPFTWGTSDLMYVTVVYKTA